MKLEYCTVWITVSSALPIYIVDVHLKTAQPMPALLTQNPLQLEPELLINTLTLL